MNFDTPSSPVLGLALAVALSACSGDAPPEDSVLDLSGAALDVVELPSDMGRVRDLHVAGDRLTVLSQFAPHLHLTDLSGGEVRSFGRAGQGPAELRSPQRLLPLASLAGVVVWDAVGSRAVAFDTLGTLLADTTLLPARYGTVTGSLAEQTHGDPLRIAVDNDVAYRVVYDGGALRPSDLRGGRLVRGGLNASDTATVLDLASILDPAAPEVEVFVPLPLWARCRGAGSTVVLDPDRRELVILTDASGVAERVAIPANPRSVDDQDLRGVLFQMALLEGVATHGDSAAIMGQFEPMVPQIRSSAPLNVPVGVDLRCFGNLDIWVQEFDNADDPMGRGSRWLRYDGRHWSEVILPPRFQPRELIGGTRLIGVARSLLDEERVAIVHLTN